MSARSRPYLLVIIDDKAFDTANSGKIHCTCTQLKTEKLRTLGHLCVTPSLAITNQIKYSNESLLLYKETRTLALRMGPKH